MKLLLLLFCAKVVFRTSHCRLRFSTRDCASPVTNPPSFVATLRITIVADSEGTDFRLFLTFSLRTTRTWIHPAPPSIDPRYKIPPPSPSWVSRTSKKPLCKPSTRARFPSRTSRTRVSRWVTAHRVSRLLLSFSFFSEIFCGCRHDQAFCVLCVH